MHGQGVAAVNGGEVFDDAVVFEDFSGMSFDFIGDKGNADVAFLQGGKGFFDLWIESGAVGEMFAVVGDMDGKGFFNAGFVCAIKIRGEGAVHEMGDAVADEGFNQAFF